MDNSSSKPSGDSKLEFRLPDVAFLRRFMDDPLCEASVNRLLAQITVEELVYSMASRDVVMSAELMKLILQVMEKLFRFSDYREKFFQNPNLRSFLSEAAKSPYSEMRVMLALQLHILACQSGARGHETIETANLFSIIALLLLDEELKISEKSAESILELISKATWAKIDFFEDDVIEMIKTKLKDTKEDALKLRVFELFCRIGAISPSLFEKYKGTSLIEYFLEIYASDDILLKMSILEIIENKFTQKYMMDYLEHLGFLDKLISELESGSLLSSMKVSVVNVLGHSVPMFPGMLSKVVSGKDCPFVNALREMIEPGELMQDEIANRLCVINVWCSIVSLKDGCKALRDFFPELTQNVIRMTDSSQNPREAYEASLMAWVTVLEERRDLIVEEFKLEIISELLPRLMRELMLQPFSGPKKMIHTIMTEVADIPETLEMYFRSKNHRENLIDASSKAFATVQVEFKFAKKALESRERLTRIIGNEEYLERLEKYVEKGPFKLATENVKIDELAD